MSNRQIRYIDINSDISKYIISTTLKCSFQILNRYVDKMRGLATILGGKEDDLREQMRIAGIALAGEFATAIEPGDPTGIMFLRQVSLQCFISESSYL